MKNIRAAVLTLAALLAACSDERVDVLPLPAGVPAVAEAPATFVNKVWRVSESAQVAHGSLYVFLAEGTLVMASAHGAPAFGKWKQDAGQLYMIEEGIEYKVDVLKLSDNIFRIRSRNNGAPVEMTLVPAGP